MDMMQCAAVGYRNEKLIQIATSLVSQLENMPAKYMSGELSSATRAMREAVDAKSSDRVIAHAGRLLKDIEGHPKDYIYPEILKTAGELKRQTASYAGV